MRAPPALQLEAIEECDAEPTAKPSEAHPSDCRLPEPAELGNAGGSPPPPLAPARREAGSMRPRGGGGGMATLEIVRCNGFLFGPDDDDEPDM